MSIEGRPNGSRGVVAGLGRLTASGDWLTSRACIGLFMAILGTMVLQIFFRYVLSTPLTWTEELARYLYIWACWLGAPVAMRRGNHVVIAVLFNRLPRRPGMIVGLMTQATGIFFLLMLAFQGTLLALRSHTVRAITLPIPWSMIYVAAPISALLMIVESIEALRKTFVQPARETSS